MPPGCEAFSNSSADALCALRPSIEDRPAGEHRRRADQRMKQAVNAVVDDLARRHGDLADAGEIVAAEAIEHGAVVGHQRLHPRRIEDMQAGDDVAVVAHFQDIGIAARQLRQHPAFLELIAGLVIVRPPQHRRECRVGRLRPDVVLVLLGELDAQLGDVARDQRLAGEVGMKRRRRVGVDRDVALPGAGNGSWMIGYQPPRPSITELSAFCFSPVNGIGRPKIRISASPALFHAAAGPHPSARRHRCRAAPLPPAGHQCS